MKKICIELTSGEKINLNLYEEHAPITVANFMHLIDMHFYDNLIFHRVIPGFMAQAGGYFVQETNLLEKQVGYTIPGEFTKNNFTNIIKHTPGVISMARTNDPNSASSQFFICDIAENLSFLDDNYAAFGIVDSEADLAVIHRICALPTQELSANFANFPAEELPTIKTVYELNNNLQ